MKHSVFTENVKLMFKVSAVGFNRIKAFVPLIDGIIDDALLYCTADQWSVSMLGSSAASDYARLGSVIYKYTCFRIILWISAGIGTLFFEFTILHRFFARYSSYTN